MSAHTDVTYSRRAFLGTLAAGSAAAMASSARAAEARPNVLLILTEDQGTQMGVLGTPGLQTPHMDKLARDGVLFRRAYVAYPVCSASKGALYTGLYAHANGIRANTLNYHKPASELSDQERSHPVYKRMSIHEGVPTLIERLAEAGYYTGVTHKLHVAPNDKFPYDAWMPNPNRRIATEFIKKAQAKEAPWFLMYNIVTPHRPFTDSDKHPISVSPDEVKLPPFLPDTPIARQDWAEYLDGIERADKLVGEALGALEDTGCADNTLVIFLGDHGPAYQRGKMTIYNFGLQVPMAIRGPGITPGRETEALASELDLMPTILDYTGEEPPEPCHGISLRPLLEGGPNAQGHDYIFAEIHHGAQRVDTGMQERSVFDGRYHLLYRENLDQPRDVNADMRIWEPWRNRIWEETIARKDEFPALYEIIKEQDPARLGGKPKAMELYDLQADPHEMHDLIGAPEHEATKERLYNVLKRWAAETGDKYTRLGTGNL